MEDDSIAFQEGYAAGRDGRDSDDNPYPDRTYEHDEWEKARQVARIDALIAKERGDE